MIRTTTYDDTLYQLVPKEPTRDMLDAYVNLNGRFQSARSDWAAMLSAAPTPPAQPEADTWATQWRECAETICTIIGTDTQVGNPSELLSSVRRWSDEKAQPEAVRVPLTDYKALYQELLFAVGMKHPDETRHQTALRYIRRAEAAHGITAAAPKQET